MKKWIFVATVNVLVITMVMCLFIAYGVIEDKEKKKENVVLSYEGRDGKCFFLFLLYFKQTALCMDLLPVLFCVMNS